MSDAPHRPMADFPMSGREDLAFENPFWSFACRLHEQPGVAHACIEAQDAFGVNVNALLYMAWLGTQGRQPSEARYRAIIDAISPWTEQVVENLRSARRAWKQLGGANPSVQSGRETLKGLELLSEQLVCAYLFRASTECDERRWPLATADAVAQNIDLVLRLSGVAADRRRELATQLAAAAQAMA